MRHPPAEPLPTARLLLEPLTTDGAAALAEEMVPVLADPSVYRFTGGAPPAPDELRPRYAAQATGASPDGSQRWLNWIVRDRAGGGAVGFVQATVEDAAGALAAELAWVVEPGERGRGARRHWWRACSIGWPARGRRRGTSAPPAP